MMPYRGPSGMASGYYLRRGFDSCFQPWGTGELDGAKTRMIAVEVRGSYWDFNSYEVLRYYHVVA